MSGFRRIIAQPRRVDPPAPAAAVSPVEHQHHDNAEQDHRKPTNSEGRDDHRRRARLCAGLVSGPGGCPPRPRVADRRQWLNTVEIVKGPVRRSRPLRLSGRRPRGPRTTRLGRQRDVERFFTFGATNSFRLDFVGNRSLVLARRADHNLGHGDLPLSISDLPKVSADRSGNPSAWNRRTTRGPTPSEPSYWNGPAAEFKRLVAESTSLYSVNPGISSWAEPPRTDESCA